MNVLALIHYEDETSTTELLNLDKMIEQGGNLETLANQIINFEGYCLKIPYEWMSDIWESKEVRLTLPATIDRKITIYAD